MYFFFMKSICSLSCFTVPFCIAEMLKPMNVLSFIFSPTNTASNITTADTDALCLVESIGLSVAYFQNPKPCDFKLNSQLKRRKLS